MHVKTVLGRIQAAGLQLDIDKCKFEVQETKYLGLIIQAATPEGRPGCVKMDPAKTHAINTWKSPKSTKDVQSFLEFANFYRRFIKNFAKLASLLIALTKKDQLFQWTATKESAYQAIKKTFSIAPVLQHFDPDKECTVETDASNYVFAAVLSHPAHEGTLKPVAFMSCRHLPAECNYEIYDKELMAIVRAFEEWRPELKGSSEPINVISNHKNLEYFMSSKQLSRRQARWSEFLSRFNFKISYKPGPQCKADALTRRSQDLPANSDPCQDYMQQVVLKPKNLSTVQLIKILRHGKIMPVEAEPTDQDLETTIENTYQEMNPENPVSVISQKISNKEHHSQQYLLSNYSLENERLYFNNKLFLPNQEPLRHRILQESHNQPMTGYPGVAKTYEILQKQYYWPKMIDSACQYIRNCFVCSRAKPASNRQGELLPLLVPHQPWKNLAMDFITELPVSSDACYSCSWHIWVVTDRLTKERHFVSCQDMMASHLARMFILFVLWAHGLPLSIVSDRGTQFTSNFWKALCQQLGITVKLSTAHHPKTDSQTERQNQALERYR